MIDNNKMKNLYYEIGKTVDMNNPLKRYKCIKSIFFNGLNIEENDVFIQADFGSKIFVSQFTSTNALREEEINKLSENFKLLN